MHEHEYGEYTNPFINNKLQSLHQQKQAFALENSQAVFDIMNAEEAELYFYIIRNLIRRNSVELHDERRFLLDIPAIKTLAHTSCYS
jgi:hypothetical protein